MNGEPVVVAEGLRKRYGDVTAVAGISPEVRRGEIFGMVGPNGAGKTTTVECIEGLRRPDAGRVTVLGLDPWRDAAALRQRMGVQLQTASLPQRIKVGEALGLFAAFYRQPADGNALLARLGLGEARQQYVSRLSGGQRQRRFVARALINRPVGTVDAGVPAYIGLIIGTIALMNVLNYPPVQSRNTPVGRCRWGVLAVSW